MSQENSGLVNIKIKAAVFLFEKWIYGGVLKSPFFRTWRYLGGIAVFLFLHTNRQFLAYQKSLYPPAGYFGYEYELSIHLNIAHNSFALVRVLRAGAFCLFQFIFQGATKSHLPNGTSERGREDKPLTPVLYSTREGGELYASYLLPTRKEYNISMTHWQRKRW